MVRIHSLRPFGAERPGLSNAPHVNLDSGKQFLMRPHMASNPAGGAVKVTASRATLGESGIIALNGAKIEDVGWIHFGAGNFATTHFIPIMGGLKRKGTYRGMGILVQPRGDDFVARVHKNSGEYSYDILPPNGTPKEETVNCLAGAISLNPTSRVGLNDDATDGAKALSSLGRKLKVGQKICISLGITEGAYNKDSQVMKDLTSFLFGIYGRELGSSKIGYPIHLYSTDNLDSIDTLKNCLLGIAKTYNDDPDFKTWLSNPNLLMFHEMMVDAAAVSDENDPLRKQREPLPTKAPPLVIYDSQKSDPSMQIPIPFAQFGSNVIVTDDIKIFEAHKKRKLLGLLSVHSSLVPLAILLGYVRVKDAMKDIDIREYVEKIAFHCAAPALKKNYHVDDISADELLQEWVCERLPNENLPHHNLAIFRDHALKMNWRIAPLIELVKDDPNTLRYLTASVVCGLNALTPIEKVRDLSDGKVVYKGKAQKSSCWVGYFGKIESPPRSGLYIYSSDMTYEFISSPELEGLISLRGTHNEATVRNLLLGTNGVLRKMLGDDLARNEKVTAPIIDGYIKTIGHGMPLREYIRGPLS